MSNADVAPETTHTEPEFGRVTSVALLLGIGASVVAGATIWLVLTDPVAVATVVETGEISPFVRRLAEVLYGALSGLLRYL